MFSCAEAETTDYYVKEQNALDAWIAINAPDAQPLTAGIYYEVISEAADPDAPTPEPGEYVKVNYEVRDLHNNVVYTRSKDMAQALHYDKDATQYTHYVPDYFVISSSASTTSVMKALYHALTTMKKGDVWRLYAPSKQVYNSQGLSNSIGYGGQYSLKSSRPAIIDNIEIVDIIDNPDLYEQQMVEKVAFSHKPKGWDLTHDDVLTKHYYREFLKRGVREDGRPDTIRVDSTARIYWKASFVEWNENGELDGFLFDTNIDSVWLNRFGGKRYNEDGNLIDDTTALNITRRSPFEISSSMPAKVFSLLFMEEEVDKMLCYGDSVRVVLTSPYAYSETGRYGYYQTSSSSNSSYYYNPYYYGYGGYDYYGSSYYNSYSSSYYNYYDTSSSSDETIYPIAEIKAFTPLIYEFVVKRPAGKTGAEEEDDDDDDENDG